MRHIETGLIHKRREYTARLKQALNRMVQQLSQMPEVERVVLFGSYVHEKPDLFTDLDVLVVMSSSQDFVTRTADLYQQISSDVDLDLLVYTPEEFERGKQKGFIQQALNTGKVIYEKART
jgi:predicted nucleotidyltransferase